MAEFRKTMAGWIRNIFILIMVLAVASCASLGGGSEKKKEEALNQSVEAFNNAFRWEDYKAASAFIDSNKKEAFWAEVDKFKGKIRMIDFQIREVDQSLKGLAGTAILYLQYYRTDSPNLLTVTFTQKWYFSEKEKGWKLAQSGYGAITKERCGI